MTEYVKKSIAEMKTGDKIDSVFSIHYKKPVSDYRHGKMFEFRAADRTGQITVKYWGGENAADISKIYDSFSRDQVVRIRGSVNEYRDKKELAINPAEGGEVRLMADGEYDMSDLIDSRDNIPELIEKFKGFIDEVKDPHLSSLLDKAFGNDEFMERFSQCPASITLHSNQVGGLIHHTVNMVEYCLLAWKQHPEMNRDILIAGALLHDIGKVESFRVTTNINQTEEGIFLGHLIIGMNLVQPLIDEIEAFPEDLRNKIIHILLSHHGKKEWGSPVEPSIPEAQAVHFADNFDAKLEYILVRRAEAATDDQWIWDYRFKRHIYLE